MTPPPTHLQVVSVKSGFDSIACVFIMFSLPNNYSSPLWKWAWAQQRPLESEISGNSTGILKSQELHGPISMKRRLSKSGFTVAPQKDDGQPAVKGEYRRHITAAQVGFWTCINNFSSDKPAVIHSTLVTTLWVSYHGYTLIAYNVFVTKEYTF